MQRTPSPLTVGLIAPLRHPLGEPHAGGLESALHDRVRALRARGHRVLLCAVDGSTPAPSHPALTLPRTDWGGAREATDSTYPPGHLDAALAAVHRALDWFAARADRIDVLDNHNLHGTPLARAADVGIPMVTTLHTPPLPAMLQGLAACADPEVHRFLAVSEHTRTAWRGAGVDAELAHNTIDTDTWRLGRGGRGLFWFGRIVPEKAPHLAIDAARRVGMPIRIAGRIGDADYFDAEVRPRLGADAVYLGELRTHELATAIGASACVLVTPMWQEPFGLVIGEALATGTPVAAFDAGGVREVVGRNVGARLVEPGDTVALAAAVRALVAGESTARRAAVRHDAVARFSAHRRIAELERLFREHAARPVARRTVSATA